MSSQVNHPPHYNAGKIEVIEFIEDQGFGPGFCRGNAIKYAARAGRKGGHAQAVEDLKKAVWYLNREIEILESGLEEREPTRPNDMNPRQKSDPVGGRCGDPRCSCFLNPLTVCDV